MAVISRSAISSRRVLFATGLTTSVSRPSHAVQPLNAKVLRPDLSGALLPRRL